jgi:hypothetical protein
MKEKSILFKNSVLIVALSFFFIVRVSAQFIDNFNDATLKLDSTAVNGWSFFTGDGSASMRFQGMGGYASILVDATKDRRNIWWALIKRCVSTELDVSRLSEPGYELQIEARIRTSHAPRRVNLNLNTQRTTDFHSHLMEFDIPDTSKWHTISMTTKDFDAQPGDTVCGQLALMDWGLNKYRVDLDYFKVQIVNVDSAGLDKGMPLPYRPPIPSLKIFANHVPVFQDAMIDLEYPNENFNNWHTQDAAGKINLLTVCGTQFIILRWDLNQFSGKQVNRSGLLELTPYSLQRAADNIKDFGMIRVSEIINGDPDWIQEDVTFNSICRQMLIDEVINTQMIIDVEVTDGQSNKNLITISQPVLQRLIDGKTFGLAIRPLGPINASFYAMENNNNDFKAKLHFNVNAAKSH